MSKEQEKIEAKEPIRLNVYEAISQVTDRLSKDGIAKDRTADTGGSGNYKFRGIDDVYNALAPFLAEAGLTILPFCLSRDVIERKSSKGNALFYTTVTMRFDFVSKWDGSKHEVCMYGEAMDSGDKGTNKAMSAAFKYACMQTFCIPTEGDNDTENQTHEVLSDNSAPSTEGGHKAQSGDVSDIKALITLGTQAVGLSDFERNFINDWSAKVKQYGDKLNKPSEKQMAIINKIAAKAPKTITHNEVSDIMDDVPDYIKNMNDEIPF